MSIDIPIQNIGTTPKRIGVRNNTSNIHSKAPSGIAKRLRMAGIDWIASFGVAIKTNDKELLGLWIRILPFLVVTGGHPRTKRLKGRASKAALAALANLEEGT